MGESGELLPERHRDGVLELGPAHLQDVHELMSLRGERRLEFIEFLDQIIQRVVDTEPEARGIGVVRRLAHVDVIVRVDDVVGTLRLTHVLEGEIRDDLVGVHVQTGSRTALEDIQRELVHRPPLHQDLVAGPDYGIALVRGQGVQPPVRERARLLDLDHPADELGNVIDGGPGDTEVVHGADGVYAVVRLIRYLECPEQVYLGTGPTPLVSGPGTGIVGGFRGRSLPSAVGGGVRRGYNGVVLLSRLRAA